MKRLLIMLILETYGVISSDSPPSSSTHKTLKYTDYTPYFQRFLSNAATSQFVSPSQLQSQYLPVSSNVDAKFSLPYSAGGYVKQNQPQEATTQALYHSSYPSNQLQQAQDAATYIRYTQLVPSFQTLQPSNLLLNYQQPYTNAFYNYTQEQRGPLNGSASEAVSATGTFPAFQNYYSSPYGNFPTWPSLTISALQPAPSTNVGGKATANTIHGLSSTIPYTFQQNGFAQGQQYVYPGFPLPSYSQAYTQLGLPASPQNAAGFHGLNQGNVQISAPPNNKVNSNDSPNTHGMSKYSSKYTKPQIDNSEKDSHTTNYKVEDSDDDSNNPKYSERYKDSESTYKSQKSKYHNDNDDDDSSEKGSFDFAEDKERPKFSHPSDDDDDQYESSSDCNDRKHKGFRSSSSGSASKRYRKYTDDDDELGINSFAEQFKSFPTNENFKDPDFSPSNQRRVTEYHSGSSLKPKEIKMIYTQHKIADNYMLPTQQRTTEVPKTFHSYAYKPPKYVVEKFPKSSLTSSQRSRDYTAQRQITPESHRDAVGQHSITTTLTTVKKMYR